MSSDSRELRDELGAALATRRELGPDYETEIVESFVAKAQAAIDARVDARLREKGPRGGASSGQRLAIGIVSVAVTTPMTAGLALVTAAVGGPGAVGAITPIIVLIWVAVVAINVAFGLSGRKH